MDISEMFSEFLSNLKVNNDEKIGNRYDNITLILNQRFRDIESDKKYSLRVGSYGRYTAIKNISDLDMLYIMPEEKWDIYKGNKQSQLLGDVRDAIKKSNPNTDIRVDRLVVTVNYTNFCIEVQPVFEKFDEDGESFFSYPDTKNGGSWKITKPRQELSAMKEFVKQKSNNLRQLCKMARAWKNKCGIAMGGLLIDTLSYNFLKSTSDYDNASFADYDRMSQDFFEYLRKQPNQDNYKALGSGQNVKVKNRFQKKAKKAYELCTEAIAASNSGSAHNKWKGIFGRPFPAKLQTADEARQINQRWNNTEEFIEDQHSVDIRYSLKIDCVVFQANTHLHTLENMLENKIPLLPDKELTFRVGSTDVPPPYDIKWKVLNRGEIAKNRNEIRGQIISSNNNKQRIEHTKFRGEHFVECYIIRRKVVVARDRVDVPIAEGE